MTIPKIYSFRLQTYIPFYYFCIKFPFEITSFENLLALKIKIMINELLIYETPLVEIIEVEVEKGFANTSTNPDGEIDPWDQNK